MYKMRGLIITDNGEMIYSEDNFGTGILVTTYTNGAYYTFKCSLLFMLIICETHILKVIE